MAHLSMPGLKASTETGDTYCGVHRTFLFRKRVNTWPGCYEGILQGKRLFLDSIARLCADQDTAIALYRDNSTSASATRLALLDARPHRRGVVFTGLEKHLLPGVLTSIVSLRLVNCSLPVEVFVDPGLLAHCITAIARKMRSVRCRSLPGTTVGYVAKFHALLLCSFAEAVLVNAGVLFLRNPVEILYSQAFKDTGAVLFPDFWGEQCRLDRDRGAVQFGHTAWSTHVIYKAAVGGLTWTSERKYAQV
jgi:hypothetical protein